MTTATESIDVLAKARADLRAAEAAEAGAAKALRDAKAETKKAVRRMADALNEVLDGAQQLRIPFEEAYRAVSGEPQVYHDDKSHVPAGERHGNSPPVEAPTWRKMPITDTGWEETLDPGVWVAIVGSRPVPWTAGELADALLAGEKFGLVPLELNDLFGLIEQISSDDEKPIRFAPETTLAELRGAFVAEQPADDFEPTPDPSAIPCPYCEAPAGESCRYASGKPKGHCLARVYPKTKPEPTTATKLATLDNFPTAVADLLLPKGISTVETLMDRVEEECKLLGDLPLLNKLNTTLVNLGCKLTAAQQATRAVLAKAGQGSAAVESSLFPEPVAPQRFVVEAGNEPWDADKDDGSEPGAMTWHVVDTTKKIAHERYFDSYPSEEEAKAAAERYEAKAREEAAKPKPEKKPAKKRKAVTK